MGDADCLNHKNHFSFVYLFTFFSRIDQDQAAQEEEEVTPLPACSIYFFTMMGETRQSKNNSISTAMNSLQSPLPHDFQLKIKRIIGTSAADKQQISIQDDLVAYTASGGVVVCKIDKESNTVTNQRFFCANANESRLQQLLLQLGSSTANAYLNMIRLDNTQEEVMRDEFGYPIANQPIQIYGNSFSPNEIDDYNNTASPSVQVNNQASPSKLKDKVRFIKCIAISPNKRLLAIGESGYQPRILIFSLASSSQQSPIMAIYEHTFGINNLVFSPDSKNLCSLGVVNDGCVNVWKLGSNNVQLQASNRCSNIIYKVIWHGNVVVTIGLRFIKLWKFENGSANKPVILKGRNALLGDFMNSNFIDMALINDEEVVLIANGNQLLLLKLNIDSPKLVALKSPDYRFNAITADLKNELIWLGADETNLKSLEIANLTPDEVSEVKPMSSPSSIGSLKQQLSGPFTIEPSAIPGNALVRLSNFSEKHLLYLTTNEEIRFCNKVSRESQTLATSIIQQISGVKQSYDNEYLIFSQTGIVEQFHPRICQMVPIFQFTPPGTEAVADCLTAIEKVGNIFILGYKFGSLYIVQQDTGSKKEVLFTVKAHSSTINDIVYFKHESYDIVCSISRDRMIQVFTKLESRWDLLQTIPLHNGNLLKTIYHNGFLYVCSTDRTISIHSLTTTPDLMMTKVKSIILKSTPIAMSIFDEELVVSTIDKQLHIFDSAANCDIKRSMKLINEKLNESLQVEMMEKFHNLLIVWSSDKSIRGFDYVSGEPVGVSWGHLDSLLGFFLVKMDVAEDNIEMEEDETDLVTIGNDGCLFSWRITESTASKPVAVEDNGNMFDDVITQLPSPTYAKVARKILPTVPKSANKTSCSTLSYFASSPPNKEKLIDRLEQAANGQKPKVQLPISSSSLSPTAQSPTPKLTAATLKRIESRNGRSGSSPCASPKSTLSPARSKSLSPVRPLANSRSSSPTRTCTSTKSQVVNNGGLSRLNQPLTTLPNSPPKRPLSPRATLEPFVRNMPNLPASNQSGSTMSELKRDNGFLHEAVSAVTPSSLMDKCMNQFNELIDRVGELSKQEKVTLLNKVNEVRCKLDDKAVVYNQDDLLNRYSDKLVELVEAKLSGSSISGVSE